MRTKIFFPNMNSLYLHYIWTMYIKILLVADVFKLTHNEGFFLPYGHAHLKSKCPTYVVAFTSQPLKEMMKIVIYFPRSQE